MDKLYYILEIVQGKTKANTDTNISEREPLYSYSEIPQVLMPCKVNSVVSLGDFILMYMNCQIFAVEWRGKLFCAYNGILFYISDYSAPYGWAMLCYFLSCQNVAFFLVVRSFKCF